MQPSIILIVAKTHGGKTYLARRLALSSSRKKHFVINPTGGTLAEKFQSVAYPELSKLQNCTLIVDDCINLTKDQYTAIAELCNKYSRHHSVYPTAICCHSLLSNNIFGLLRLVSYTVLLASAHPANVKAALNYSGLFDKAEVQVQLKTFIQNKDPFAIFLLDTIERTFSQVTFSDLIQRLRIGDKNFEKEVGEKSTFSSMALLDPNFLESLNRGAKILELSENPVAAGLLFKFLCQNFADRMDMNDYSLTLKKKNSKGNLERYSILDLADLATSSNKKPEPKAIWLLEFIKKRLLIPQTLIKNNACRRILEFP